MKQPLVSVIIPIYQVYEYLDKCIESVVDQTYSELEIILVDDGTPDSCAARCDEWAERDARITVIHKSNGGLSDARNYGIEISIGSYIGFVDSDDYTEPQMYELMFNVMQDYNADYCACGVQTEYDSNGKSVFRKREFFVGDSEQTLEKLYTENEFPVWSWCKLSKRKLWDDLRFPVGKNYEDAFTTYLLIDKSNIIVRIPDMCYHYRIREDSIMTDTTFSYKRLYECDAWEENFLFVKNHYPRITPFARFYWLEHIAITLSRINGKAALNIRCAKRKLLKKLLFNLPSVFFECGIKKVYSLLMLLRYSSD